MVLQTSEIVLILLVILLLFGASSIPKLMRSLGRAQGEFTKAKREFEEEARLTAAGAGSTAASTGAALSEDQVRRTARDLGIAEQGRSLDEVKLLIQQKLA
jgi:sec-independent protein translocase protein TatA